MPIQTKLTELIARDGFYAHILMVLANGQNDSMRFPPCEYFTIPFEGDEVVLTDQDRTDIETALGQPLIEGPALGINRGTAAILRLCTPIALKADIDAVLSQHARNALSANT